jgi:predicted metal-binding protein
MTDRKQFTKKKLQTMHTSSKHFFETEKLQGEFMSFTKLQIEEKQREKCTQGVNIFGQPPVPPKC